MITCNEEELQDKIFKLIDEHMSSVDESAVSIIKDIVKEAIAQNDLVALSNIIKMG